MLLPRPGEKNLSDISNQHTVISSLSQFGLITSTLVTWVIIKIDAGATCLSSAAFFAVNIEISLYELVLAALLFSQHQGYLVCELLTYSFVHCTLLKCDSVPFNVLFVL